MAPDTLLILIAPNVSRRMGGEAIKALQIFDELSRLHPKTVQITHGRNRDELRAAGLDGIEFIDDDRVSRFLWKSRILAFWLDVRFSRQAVQLADRIAARIGGPAVVLQTEPNSPVVRRALSKTHVNAFGPLNGNIYYPAIFRHEETWRYRLRRVLHLPLQRVNRRLPGSLKAADQILVAGGERTAASLRAAGCSDAILKPSLDCGVPDSLLDRPRIRHAGRGLVFVHCGRLVVQKCTALLIESLARTRLPVRLDVIGQGPELERCTALVERLRLGDRVRFAGWATQDALHRAFAGYRGLVLPSMEDSNGIVIQEALALGLPPICLDWGGPSLLIEHGRSGWLVEPTSLDRIKTDLAAAMDRLAEDGELADAMSAAGRATAESWRWSRVAADWLAGLPTPRRPTA